MAFGIFNEHGVSTAGGAGPIVIIGPTTVPASVDALVTEFGATLETPGSNARVILQMSDDGFVANIWDLDEINMPTPGKSLSTYDSSIQITRGLSFRVIFTQTMAGRITVTLTGATQRSSNEPNPTSVRETWLNGVGTVLP